MRFTALINQIRRLGEMTLEGLGMENQYTRNSPLFNVSYNDSVDSSRKKNYCEAYSYVLIVTRFQIKITIWFVIICFLHGKILD